MSSLSLTRLGQGTYGQVFRKADGTVMKQVDKVDRYSRNKWNIELSSICEMAILKIKGIPNTPKLQYITEDSQHYYIHMQDCGCTLLEYARTLSCEERQKFAPQAMFQLLQAAIAFEELGILHNDIKSGNVMVDSTGKVRLIDFGINVFETVDKVDGDLISRPEASYAKQFGTYCVCPPETFLDEIWNADKYMAWSIGVTMCEFIFKTHSFICDNLLEKESQQAYQKAYRNEPQILHFLAMIFYTKARKGETSLAKFENCKGLAPELADFLNKALMLDYNKRSSLRELYDLPMFDRFRERREHIVPMFDRVTIFGSPVKAAQYMHSDTYSMYRTHVIEWMFDIYNATGKLCIFVQAVNILDRYMASGDVVLQGDIVIVACAAAYIAQYALKEKHIDLSTIISSVSWISPAIPHHTIYAADVNARMQRMLVKLDFDLYRKTFDTIIAKQGIEVDMETVLRILTSTVPPYDNAVLISSYRGRLHETRSKIKDGEHHRP